ncbi:multidrug transporter [Stenotrophomonas ginsengisoli]|uniref:Multidrug transporter n=1 Tax=Stenotrophomonas ginsengisoli TaxID=336566 RepID=A0A0R0DKD7_9GAMM|nr:MFS transporter [Stenotrophomonas ginsengisoli]KRG78855.1 multidrug transporter [Stenotrophomonas ginsengisoli]
MAGTSAWPLLRQPGLRWLLGYRIAAMLSYQIVAVAVGWQVYQRTGDAFALGLIGLAEVLPFLCVAPFAGHLVDHLPRRRLGLAACTGLLLTAAALLLTSLPALSALPLWPVYAAIVVTGMVRAFLTPVYMALFARVLARADYAGGASLGSVAFTTALVIGPALGGGLIAIGGSLLAYAVAACCAALAAAALLRLRVDDTPPATTHTPVLASIAEGARFVWNNPVMLAAMALDMFSVLLGGVVAMLPAFIDQVLQAGPQALGLLRAAPAVGALLTGLWLARRPPNRHAGWLLLGAVAGFGLSILGFSQARQLWLAAAFLLCYGAFDGVSVVLRQTIFQLATPDAMRGRVASINGIFISSSNELGAFYAGSMARLLGLLPAMVVGGSAVIAVAAITAWRSPVLRRLHIDQLR